MGIDVEILDLISLKPLDLVSIKASIRKTHRVIIVEESSRTGGVGGDIMASVIETCANELDELPVRLSSKDVPTPYNRLLEEATVVTPDDIVNTVLWMFSAKSGTPKLGSEIDFQQKAVK